MYGAFIQGPDPDWLPWVRLDGRWQDEKGWLEGGELVGLVGWDVLGLIGLFGWADWAKDETVSRI